jgi:predicted dehydrogenase
MPRTIRVALAGLGSVSQRGILPHLAQPDALARVELVACCDTVAERARETARRYGWAQHYADYDEMLARADVEAVLLATPIPLHFEQTMKALGSGRHVYVQKTMTTSLAEANEIIALAERTGRVVVASPGQMLNPTFQQFKRLIAEGALGKIYWAFSTNAGGGHEQESFRAGDDVLSNVDPTWYYKPGGGPVYDMAVYSLHTLTGILGPARAVTALSGIGRPERRWKEQTITVEMDDNTLMLLDFGDATLAVAGGQNCPVSPGIGWGRLAFFGTAGSIDVGPAVGGVEITSATALPEALGFPAPRVLAPLPPGNARLQYVVGPHAAIPEAHVYNDIMHLCDCILDGRPPVASAAHARHVVEIIEKGYRAARTGVTQTIESGF